MNVMLSAIQIVLALVFAVAALVWQAAAVCGAGVTGKEFYENGRGPAGRGSHRKRSSTFIVLSATA
jgi:hypothetical protein